jgi:glyoxalase family protein
MVSGCLLQTDLNQRKTAIEFKELIPEFSVFDIRQTKDFYEKLGFKTEYERKADKFVFMSFQGSQFMFEQIHDKGWNTGELDYPLGRGINFSIATDNVEALYETVKKEQIAIYRELTRSSYEIQGGIVAEPVEFLIQDPNGYLLRFTN